MDMCSVFTKGADSGQFIDLAQENVLSNAEICSWSIKVTNSLRNLCTVWKKNMR
ncbi:MAG: hypothetical protein O3B83_00200 [Bacteroidetes bacterium]|nr:hypothetical protein [Bacteroidota bacterium]